MGDEFRVRSSNLEPGFEIGTEKNRKFRSKTDSGGIGTERICHQASKNVKEIILHAWQVKSWVLKIGKPEFPIGICESEIPAEIPNRKAKKSPFFRSGNGKEKIFRWRNLVVASFIKYRFEGYCKVTFLSKRI